jgi:hypothetical protein
MRLGRFAANSLVFDGEQIPVADDSARIRLSIEPPSVERRKRALSSSPTNDVSPHAS